MEYVHDQPFNGGQKISGRCLDGEYYLEPCAEWGLPPTEVNVSVAVKLKSLDAPIVLSRPYIPVVKGMDIYDQNIGDFASIYNHIVSIPKQNGKITRGPIFDYQMKRIHAMRRYLDNEFEFKAVSTLSEGCYDIAPALADSYHNGLDSWDMGVFLTLDQAVQEGNWNFEWSYDKPATPWAYELTAVEYPYPVPVTWKLYAKLNEGDEWTLLDQQIDNTDWYESLSYNGGPYPTLFKVSQRQPWQYYRLEVTKKSRNNKYLNFQNFKLLF
jgi:hypothetical protein